MRDLLFIILFVALVVASCGSSAAPPACTISRHIGAVCTVQPVSGSLDLLRFTCSGRDGKTYVMLTNKAGA